MSEIIPVFDVQIKCAHNKPYLELMEPEKFTQYLKTLNSKKMCSMAVQVKSEPYSKYQMHYYRGVFLPFVSEIVDHTQDYMHRFYKRRFFSDNGKMRSLSNITFTEMKIYLSECIKHAQLEGLNPPLPDRSKRKDRNVTGENGLIKSQKNKEAI